METHGGEKGDPNAHGCSWREGDSGSCDRWKLRDTGEVSKRRRTDACESHETPIRESSPATGSAYPTGESFEGLDHMTDGKENLWGTRERGERHRGDRSTLGAQRPGRGGCQARESTSQWAGSGLTTARNSVSSSERGRGRWDFTAREAEEEEEGETRDPGRGRLCKHRSRRR